MAEQQFDFGKGPHKVFVDTIHAKVINGLHHITFQSGKELFSFTLPLPLSKIIGKGLLKQVEEIEHKTGKKIDVRLPDEPMVSPWSSGLNGGDPKKGDSDTPDSPKPKK